MKLTDNVKLTDDLLARSMQRCNAFLDKILATNDIGSISNIGNNKLNSAMRYAVMNGGKRLRPALVYATGEVLGISAATLDAAAASIELIHCYSLVHDDLPAMDDDDLRRGMPSCHKAFDEATAILAGDALQTLAFELLSNIEFNPVAAEARINMVQVLAQAAGANGMVLGQALDIAAECAISVTTQPVQTSVCKISPAKIALVSSKPTLDELIAIHKYKTGALFSAAIHLALCLSDADMQIKSNLCDYAKSIGLGFQIADDILDVTASTEILGKPAGSDQKLGKTTFPALLGLNAAKEYANNCHQQALTALTIFGKEADILRDLSSFLITRNY